MDVEFKPYQNFKIINGTQVLYGNRSYFSNSSFTTDELYPFTSAPNHIIIDGCYGIIFVNCQYSILSDPPFNLYASIGIKSIDGGFSVHGVNTKFENFWHGIDAIRISTNRPIRVYNATFNDNQTGIIANNINNIVVQRCTLNIGNNQNPNWSVHTGITLDKCSGYTIEENHFNPTGNAVKYGIVTRNSGSADNQIYLNTFNGMSYGNVASIINRDNSNPALHGLQYLCNKNQQSGIGDFFIAKQVGTTLFGIRAAQGTTNIPAGNTFSHLGPAGTPTDINNKASGITYYYWSGAAIETPQYYNSPNVVTSSVTAQNTCPSNITCHGCIPIAKLSPEEWEQLRGVYDSSEAAYLNLLYTYNQLMDGGSTNALLNQIQQSWSADANQLRLELLEQSPYLSQDILREVASGNVLPQAMLLEVCMANPDATRDEKFLEFLLFDIPNPLPQYMIDMIIASWETETARTAMESSLADYSSKMVVTSDKLLADLYFRADFDSTLEDPDTTDYNLIIRYWLQRIQTLTAKYDLIENYFKAEEFEIAQNILDSIPYNFNLSEDQQAAYYSYVYFHNFRKSIINSGLQLSELTGNEIDELVNFTSEGDDFAKGLARNLLCHYYNICTEQNYDLDTGGDRIRGNTHDKAKNVITNNSVSASPNPASSFVNFNYTLTLIKEKAILVIYDATGHVIEQMELNNQKGNQTWNTSNVQNGLYYFYVKDRNTTIASGKVVVKK